MFSLFLSHSRLKALREWGALHLSKGLRTLHQRRHRHGTSLSTIVQHHRDLGVAPGLYSRHRKFPLYESPTCKQLISEKYAEICRLVKEHCNTKNPHIHSVIISLFARLAAFDPDRFSQDLGLEFVTNHLLTCIRQNRDRGGSFEAIGLIAVALQDRFLGKSREVFESIKMHLPARDLTRKRNVQLEPAVFACITLLAQALGDQIRSDIDGLLDCMIATGLNRPLTRALYKICLEIPSLRKEIHSRLVKVLFEVLLRQPYKHPGAPRIVRSPPNHVEPDHNTIVLGLQTFAQFDFSSRPLSSFVKNCADMYLQHENKDIRLEAVRTCSKLLIPALIRLTTTYSLTLISIIRDVIAKLLVVGVTDTEYEVRYTVLENLDDRFDSYLAQAENLSSLFVCLNDERFEIRELALCTIGRLSNINPAYVMPPLRKVLLQLLTELQYSGMGRNKEQAAKMLGHLLSNAPRITRFYTEPIVKVFISKLKEQDPYPGASISVLHAVGEQAGVSGPEMSAYKDELFPIMLEVIQDSTSLPKREVGLWTLGHLIECTGYVIEPYQRYPNLLDILLNFLKADPGQNVATAQVAAIRLEAIRVLGLLGAIDPYIYKVSIGVIDHHGDLLLPVNDPTQEPPGEFLIPHTDIHWINQFSYRLLNFIPR